MMQLYRETIQSISLSGPTYFGPIIQQQINIINTRGAPNLSGGFAANLYNILLIITDGEIHDMQQTKDLIVASSRLPLSVIIIGVGNE